MKSNTLKQLKWNFIKKIKDLHNYALVIFLNIDLSQI